MTPYDQSLLDSLARIIPLLTYVQKEKLLSYGEGMAFANSEKGIFPAESDKTHSNQQSRK